MWPIVYDFGLIVQNKLQNVYKSNSDEPDKRSFVCHVVIIVMLSSPFTNFDKVFVLMYGTNRKISFVLRLFPR